MSAGFRSQPPRAAPESGWQLRPSRWAPALLAVALCGSLWLGVPGVTAAEGEQEALAGRVLLLSGWAEQIEQIPALALSTLEERTRAGDVQRDAAPALRGALGRAFDPERLRTNTQLAFLRGEVPVEKLRALIALLQQPVVARMTELELRSASAEGRQGLRDFVDGMGAHPPGSERLALIERLNGATRAQAFAVEMMAVVTEGILRAAEAATPQHLRTPSKVLESRVRDLRPELERRLHSLVLVSQLYTYHAAADGELSEYVELLESPLGRWFNRQVGGAFLDALSRSAEAAVDEVRGRSEV